MSVIAQASRVGVVVTRCPTCGTIVIYQDSTRLKKIDPSSSRTLNRQIIMLAAISSRRAVISVRTLSIGRPVKIDGLVLFKN